MSSKNEILTRILYINGIASIIFITFYPLIRDSILNYVDSVNWYVPEINNTIIPGIQGNFDTFGLILFILYSFIILILNYIFFNQNKGIMKKRNYIILVTIPITLSLFTVFFLVLSDFIIPTNITNVFKRNTYTMIPVIFLFILVDYFISIFFITEKDLIIIE